MIRLWPAYGTVLFCLILPVSIAGMNIAAGLLTLWIPTALVRGEKLPWRRLLKPACLALAAYCLAAVIVSLAGVEPTHSIRTLFKDFQECL